jgi:hypothetical protein
MTIGKLLLCFVFAGSSNIQLLRTNYFEAAENEKQLTVFQKSIDTYPKKDQTYYCYLAAYQSLLSNYAPNISAKLKTFKLCKTNLEKSFTIQESFDAHFIRFCIQTNVPSILDYKDKIKEDKNYLLTNLKNTPESEFKQKVKLFLAKSKALDKAEKEKLNKL